MFIPIFLVRTDILRERLHKSTVQSLDKTISLRMVTSCEHLLSINKAANFFQKFRKKILPTVWKKCSRSSMSAYNLVDKQFGYDMSINCRDCKRFWPFRQVVWKHNNVSVARLRYRKWANTVNSDSFKRIFHWNRQQRSFIDGTRAFFHSAVNTSAAPMLDVVEHAAPIVRQS